MTVNIQPGSQIEVININGILIGNQNQVTNQGAITVAGNTFDGITLGSNNTITNSGAITLRGFSPTGCSRLEITTLC